MKIQLLLITGLLGLASLAQAGTLSGHLRDQNWYARRSTSEPFGVGYYEFAINANATSNNAAGGYAGTGIYGEFSMPNLAAGQYTVVSWDVWWRPAFAYNINVPASGNSIDVDLRLHAAMWGYAAFWDDTGYYEFGQTFVASGPVTMIYLRDPLGLNFTRTITIHQDQPGGAQIGATRTYGSGGDQRLIYGYGEMPTVAGRRYYLRIRTPSPSTGGVLMQMDPRPDYSDPMPGGCLWLGNGTTLTPYPDRDLGVTILCDDDGLITDLYARSGGVNLSGTNVGQSFIARGTSLVAASFWLADGNAPLYAVRVYEGGPTGTKIGATKRNKPARLGADPEVTFIWTPGELLLTPGQTYYIEISRDDGLSFGAAYANPYNPFGYGQAYSNRVALATWDLAGAIIEEASAGSAMKPAVKFTSDPSVPEAGRVAANFTVQWTTDAASDSAVEFAANNPPYTATNSSAALTTNHSVILSGLLPNTMYHFRAISRAAGKYDAVSRDFVICTLPNSQNLLTNPGFELGSGPSPRAAIPGWSVTGTNLDLKAVDGSWFSGVPPRSGRWFVEGAHNGNPDDGYIYQRVNVTAGRDYTFSAWVTTWPRENSTWKYDVWYSRGRLTYMRLGIDPSGGANPRAASVQWTPRMYSHLRYTHLAKTATAQNTNLTVFVAMNGDGEEWGIYGVDETALTEAGAAPLTNNVTQAFESMPLWNSAYEAAGGSAATFLITANGQSGNALEIGRASEGSSTRVLVLPIPTGFTHALSIYGRCPASANTYWAECACKLGVWSANDLETNTVSWSMVQRFSNSGINGNGDIWTLYSTNFDGGTNAFLSAGFRLGSQGGPAPTAAWDSLHIVPLAAPFLALADTNANTIEATFNAPLEPVTASILANYTLRPTLGGPALALSSVTLKSRTQLLLSTAPFAVYTDYTLTVSNVVASGQPFTSSFLNGAVPVHIPFSLIPLDAGTSWKYRQDGVDLGTGWRARLYNDGSWASGAALLAYETCGCLPEPIRTTLTTNNGKSTFYFRRAFNFPPGNSNGLLRLNYIVDDGVVFYVNGAELWRAGVTNNPVYYTNYASRTVDNAAYEGPYLIWATNLVATSNVLAVEVHQVNAGSTDVAFGATLDGMVLPSDLAPVRPRLQISYPRPLVQLTWDAPGFVLDTATALTGPWTQTLQQVPPVTLNPTNNYRFFRLRQ